MACRIADSVFLFVGPRQRPICSPRIETHFSTGIHRFTGDNVLVKGDRCGKYFSHLKGNRTIQSMAIQVAPSSVDGFQFRKQLAESFGFKQVGEPLPENVTLKDVMDTLPKKVFEIDDVKAWKSVLISVTSYALGLFMISKVPWYLLPLAWAWTGTAVTGVSFLCTF
uniref:Omega-6 fatty acid desaturaseic n=1 Tax=Rhizophora mucronata TaxID=61149 RepID=A0A2P2LBA9_RHIMU